MPKRNWLNDRLNRQRFDGGGSNDDAFAAQERAATRRRALRMVTPYPFVETDAAIESAWDEERREREQ